MTLKKYESATEYKYALLKRKEKEHRKQIARLQKALTLWKKVADGYLKAYIATKSELNTLRTK